MSITASLSVAPSVVQSIEVLDDSRFDPKCYGALADGKFHPLSERYNDPARAKGVYPFITHLGQSIDWCALQAASNAARDRVRATLGAGNAIALFRTICSNAPLFYVSPGRYVINWPVTIYPHVSARGTDQGHCIIKLADTGWATGAPVVTVNPQGVMWLDKHLTETKASALLWMEADTEWPVGSKLQVAGMVCSVSNLGLHCHHGACFFSAGNQNQFDFVSNWINGYGDGPTGAVGFLSNNPASGTQITNFTFRRNTVEGFRTGLVVDKLEAATVDNNQFDNVANAIYAGSVVAGGIDHNLITCFIKGRSVRNGIWVGLGDTCSIGLNKIHEIEPGADTPSARPASAIRVLGRGVNIIGNIIRVINEKLNIRSAGYGIHLVTGRNQFGGDVSLLGGQYGPIVVGLNNITCDFWPLFPIQAGIWAEEAPGEKLKVVMFGNSDSPSLA
jgi:hypothetical protein